MRRLLLIVATLLLAGGVLTSGVDAGDAWPFHRGPNFNNHVPGERVRASVPDSGPEVLWTADLGKGYSGIVGADGFVYTQCQTLGGQYVVCLDAKTGAERWRHRYAFPYEQFGLYPGPRSTPTLHAGRIYFTGPLGAFGCLDARTGKSLWRRDLFDEFDVEPPEFGYSLSPVIVDDVIYLPVGTPGRSLVAFDPDDGQTLWQAGDDRISHTPVYPIMQGGERVLILYLRNSLVAYDTTGQLLWRRQISSGYDEHAAWPIWSEPHLWISGPFKAGSELLELTIDPPGAKTVWKSRDLSNDVCSSVLVDGYLYGFDLREAQSKVQRPSRGTFQCLDFQTGEVQWSNGTERMRRKLTDAGQTTDDGEPIVGQASVLVASDKLVMLNDLGELIVAEANPSEYRELWRTHLLRGEVVWTQPTLMNGCLYARNQTRLVCVALRPPAELGLARDQELLTIEDIPQGGYRDWTAILLPVEPYYSMDAPTRDDFLRWYVVSLQMMGGSLLVAGVLVGLFRLLRRRTEKATERVSRVSLFHGLTLTLWFVCGVVGTTAIGRYAEEFVFTWPLALFVLFHLVVLRIGKREEMTRSRRVLDWLALLTFLGGSLLYFFACRRVSLAFEWCFLVAYPAAVPFCLLAKRWSASWWRVPLVLVLSWTLFVATSYAIIWAKYGG